MTPFETTLGFIALAVLGIVFLLALGWIIRTEVGGEHAADEARRQSHGR
jgi:hypothetical protein